MHTKFWHENLKQETIRHEEHVGVHQKIMLKGILNKWNERVLAEFIQLGTRIT
jgi:hypothetical protein